MQEKAGPAVALSSSSFLTCSVVAASCPRCSRGLQGLRDSSADAEGGADFRHDLNTTTAAETETRCSFVSGDSIDTSFSNTPRCLCFYLLTVTVRLTSSVWLRSSD
jgi:hypothetical protein